MAEIDTSGIPEPRSQEDLDNLSREFHAAVHESTDVCCVCDEFCRTSQSELLEVENLPAAFFTLLKKPDGKQDSSPVLQQLLCDQYNISSSFPRDRRFKHILLSPRGLHLHRRNCDKNSCDCVPHLRICKKQCYSKLERGNLPKYAIANGNWIGQLPPDLRKMTFGTK